MKDLKDREIINIPISQVMPNKTNPNKMGKAVFDRLKLSIKEFGLFYPILVRKIGDKYEIADGQWRWQACNELGWKEIPAMVMEEITEDDLPKIAFTTTIKGKMDVSKASLLMRDLSDTEGSKNLRAYNLDKHKLDKKVKFLHLKEEAQARTQVLAPELEEESQAWGFLEKRPESFDAEVKDIPVVLSLVFNKDEYEFVVGKLEDFKKHTSEKSFSKVLVQLLKEKMS
jgi:ParB/RepB/Spo0J family partition protein